MLNSFIGMGRLTKDPELRYTQAQTPVVSFTVAIDRDFQNKDAEKATDFVDCIAWRSTAEFISKYFHKGSLAAVEGRLQFRDWVDKNNNKRRNAEILVENIYFGESRKDGMPVVVNEATAEDYGGETGGELPF